MEPIQSCSFRLSARLEEFEASPLFQGPVASEADLRRWANASSPSQPAAAAPFSAIYAAVASYGSPGGPAPSLASALASRLGWVALEAVRQLQALAAGRGPDAGNPRARLAAQNCLKLAAFFLVHLQRKAGEAQVGASPAALRTSQLLSTTPH